MHWNDSGLAQILNSETCKQSQQQHVFKQMQYVRMTFVRKNSRNGVKNHLFFPLENRSSNAFLIVFFASSRCDCSLNVSPDTAPFRPSSSIVYRVGIR